MCFEMGHAATCLCRGPRGTDPVKLDRSKENWIVYDAFQSEALARQSKDSVIRAGIAVKAGVRNNAWGHLWELWIKR